MKMELEQILNYISDFFVPFSFLLFWRLLVFFLVHGYLIPCAVFLHDFTHHSNAAVKFATWFYGISEINF